VGCRGTTSQHVSPRRATDRRATLPVVRTAWVIVALLAGCVGGTPGSDAPETTEASPSSDASTTTDGTGSDEADLGTTGAPTSCVPTMEGVRASVLLPRCATGGCHDAATAAASLDLSVDDPEASLANAPSGTCDGEVLLVPGDAAASYLMTKLGSDPACGDPMPPGDPLEQGVIDCMAEWIAQAQSDCPTCGTQTCIDLESSPQHCGACDAPCPAGVACIAGECACPAGTAACGDACVDTDSDPAHCGGCDQPCEDGLFCLGAGCASDCGGLTECAGACVDLATNPLHCGDCNAPCGDAQVCQAGSCGCDAPPTSYAADVEPFIVAECASNGCHRPMGMSVGSEDLDLSEGAGYDALVGVPAVQCGDRMLVEPGEPGSSYLYDKVLGVNLCSGTQMPKAGSGLPAAQLQAIADWICSGAAP